MDTEATKTPNIKNLIATAENLLSQGDQDGAERIFTDVLLTTPNHIQALTELYKSSKKQNKLDEAYKFLIKIIKLKPAQDNIQNQLRAGIIQLSLNKKGKAKQHLYASMLSSTKHSDQVNFNLAKIMMREKQYEVAYFYLSIALDTFKANRSLILFLMVKCLHELEQHTRLTEFYQLHQEELDKNENFIKLKIDFNSSELVEKVQKSEIPVVCVLGMHRSGTSSLAGSVQAAGFGSHNISTWNYDNVQGNREDTAILKLNESILQYNGLSWQDVSNEKQMRWSSSHVARRNELIAQRESLGKAWSFKDPRTLFLIDFWREGLANLIFVGSIRHPFKSALSLNSRNDMKLSSALTLWKQYNEKLLKLAKETSCPIIQFDATKESYIRQLNAMFDFLGANLPDTEVIDKLSGFNFYNEKLEADFHQSDFDKIADLADCKTEYKEAMQLFQELQAVALEANIAKHHVNKDANNALASIISAEQITQPIDRLMHFTKLLYEINSDSLLTTKIVRLAKKHDLFLSKNIIKQLASSPDPETKLLLAQYLTSIDEKRAKSILTQLHKAYPDFIEARHAMAELHLKRKDAAQAAEHIAKVLELRPHDAKSHLLDYRLAKIKGDVAALYDKAKKAVALAPNNTLAQKYYVLAAAANQEWSVIKFAFSNPTWFDTFSFSNYLEVAHALNGGGQFDLFMACQALIKVGKPTKKQSLNLVVLQKNAVEGQFPGYFKLTDLFSHRMTEIKNN